MARRKSNKQVKAMIEHEFNSKGGDYSFEGGYGENRVWFCHGVYDGWDFYEVGTISIKANKG